MIRLSHGKLQKLFLRKVRGLLVMGMDGVPWKLTSPLGVTREQSLPERAKEEGKSLCGRMKFCLIKEKDAQVAGSCSWM